MTRGLRMKRKLPSFDIKFINLFVNELREAFIKKKIVTNVTIGGGSCRQNVTIFKVVFKIYFRPF